MKIRKITQNPYLFFSPFLIVLLAITLFFKTNGSLEDEARYLTCARNLLKGIYSPPAPDIYLPNGPGYPILLVPFLALRLPLICTTIMNAVFYYFSIVLIYKTLQQLVLNRLALIISLFWACYINAYQYIPLISSETLAQFLVSLIIFNIVKAFSIENSSRTKKYLFLSGFLIGYLVLTKVIFGYVLLFMLAGSVLLWIFKRKSIYHKKGVIILIIALATNAPYLIYTYHLTGKMFYWSSFGGVNLYWMTTPFKGEYGDADSFLKNTNGSVSSVNQLIVNDTLRSNYLKKYEEIMKYPPAELDRDIAFKKIAINNIKSYPQKFILNCFCNVGRILFDSPYSYTLQKPQHLLRLPFNGIIIVLMFFCLIPTLFNWRNVSYSIRFLLFFALLYFGGSILGCAETRMFTVIVPVLLVWIAIISAKSINVKLKFDQ
jgi:4-amino-4-deoxy-L-arabinose transferase-like glycosyltransferase